MYDKNAVPEALNPHSFYVLDTRDLRIYYLEPMTRIKLDSGFMVPHQSYLLIRGDGLVLAGSLDRYGDGYNWNGDLMQRFVAAAIRRHQSYNSLFITPDGLYLLEVLYGLPSYSVKSGTTATGEQLWAAPAPGDSLPDSAAMYHRAMTLYIRQGETLARYYKTSTYDQGEQDILRAAGLYFL